MSIKLADIPNNNEMEPLPPVQPLDATAPMDDEHWNKIFTDQEYFDGIAKSRGVTEAMRTSLHGEDYPYRQAMMGYLSASRNVPMEDVRKIYDEEKDGFAQRVLGKPTASSRELFDWQKQQFARANERNAAARTMMENVIKRSLEDALTGGSNDHTRAVTEDLTSYGEMFNEAEQLDLRKKADELDIQVRRAQAMVSEDARWLFDALRQNTGAVDRGVAAWQGGQAVPEMEEVAKRFATLPEQQRKAVYELVAGFGQIAKVDKGFWYQMAESLGRGVSDVAEVTPRVLGENALEAQLAQLEDAKRPVFLVPGRTGEVRVERFDLQGTGPASPEERAQAAERIREKLAVRQVQRELRDLAERVVDPIKTVTNLPEILEEGLYGAARSLPYTAVAAVPYVGMPAVATALYAQNYDRLRLEHPELPAGKVALVAAASAPIEAALERLQVKLITGRLPWLGGLVKKMAHPNQRNITRIMLGSGGILLEQNAQETVQELTFPVARTVAAALDEDMPGFDWQEKIEGMPRELAVQFVALLPLSLVGMGALTVRELRRGGDYIKDKANLEKVGLSPEQVDRVLGAETLEEAEAIYQEEYNRRDPERAKAAAMKLIEEMANTPNLSQKPEMPTVERQGADYVVRNREGVEMLRTQDPDAATYEFNKLMQSREQAFYEAQVALVEMLRKAKEARGLTPDVSEIELVAKEVIEPYATMTPEELEQRRKQYELEYGTEAAGALEVVGVNVAQMRDGVFRDVSKIVRGSDPLVVVEEVVEGELKRAWQDGRFSREDMIGWIRQYERASGENILTGEGDADVIEATSSLGVAYFMGQSRRDSLPDKLRAFFEWLSQYLRAIMARAVRLEQALAEGEVDQRFEAFLAQSLGMDLDAILEKQAKAALSGILTGTEGESALAQPQLTDPSGVARGKEFSRVNEQNVQALNAYLDGLEEGFYPVMNGDGEQTYVVKVTRRKDGSKRVELWTADGKELVGDRRSVVTELNYAPSQDGQGNTVWTKAELGAGQKRIYEELTPEQEEELAWQAMQDQQEEDLDGAKGSGDVELFTAIASAGGLPSPGTKNARQYSGELRTLRETLRVGRDIQVKGAFNLFRTDAPDLDALTKELRRSGFVDVQTPDDLFELIDRRIRGGKPIYGYEGKGWAEVYEGQTWAVRENRDNFSLVGLDAQAYFDFANVPQSKQQAGQQAVDAAAQASVEPYEADLLSSRGGVDGSGELRSARERQAAAYQALLGGDANFVAKAIREGVPLSRLMLGFIGREPVSFNIRGAIIENPRDLALYNLAHRTPFFESLKIVVVDTANQVIASQVVSTGTVNESLAHPRDILAVVETARANHPGVALGGFMVMHNHPSGNPSPSSADKKLTERLAAAGDEIGVPLIDHVVTNGESFYSFRENREITYLGAAKNDPAAGRANLPVLARPEGDIAPGAMAEWEVLPASVGQQLSLYNNDILKGVQQTLQTADPNMIHVINVDTRHGIISVDRYPLGTKASEAVKRSITQGTYGVFVSLPSMTLADAGVIKRDFLGVYQQTYSIPLLDVAAYGQESFRSLGLLEEADAPYSAARAVASEQRAVDGAYPVAGPSYAVRLVSVHKLSEENLAFAEQMGGLAVPSVAVTKVGNVVDGFGKVALIGGRELGDPEANPVFDADAYTSRFPRPEYKKVKQAVAQRVVNKLRPYEQKFGDGRGMSLQEVWDNAVNRPQPDETVNKLLRSNMAKAAYLGLVEGVEVEPQMREVPQRWGLMGTRAMQEYVAQGGGFNLNYDDAAGLRRLAEVVMAAVEEQVAGKSPEVQRMLREAMRANVNEDGTFAFGRQLPLEQDARNYGKMEVDAEATGKVLDEALRGKEAAFDRWVNETIRGMYEAPRIKVNGRWEPYTLENIVRVMTAGRIVGAEQTMTFGEGQLRAASSRRFGSVQEMKNVAEEGIATEAEVKARRDVVNARLGAWREALMGYYKWQSSWDALDNSMMAMAGYLKAQSSTETAMRRALLSKDFVGVPAEVVREGMEIAAEFRNVPVPYFESKPQRVVRLGEFKAAVVAGDVSPETVNILNRHGIEVYTVDSASTAADDDVQAAMEKAGDGVSFAVRPSGAGAGENVAVLDVEPKLTGMSKRDAAETILPVLRGYQKLDGDALPFNKDLGQRVRFSGKTTGKLVSYASHTLEDMELAFILPMLIENAVLVESRADRYGNPEIRSVKILASVARVNGKVYAAKLTVFDRQDGAVLYDVTGKEMRLAPSVVQVPEGTSTTLASLGANVDDLVRAVKGDSEVSRAVRSQRYYDEVERALVALDNDPVYRRGRVGSALKRFKKIRDQFSRKDAEPLSQMEAIAFMEALISILPPQMQGRVGGRVRIAQFKTAQGRRNYILNRIAKVDEVLEEYLREEYNADAVRLFARARPQRDEAGQKPKGKLGYSVHELFKTLQEATEWTPEEAEAHVAKLEKRMGAEEILAEEEAHIALESQLVPLFADWLHADAQRRQDAVMLGQEVWTRAYQAERARVERMRQEREAAREELARAAGSEGDAKERYERLARENGLSAKWEGAMLNLLNFDQVISYVFGEKSEVVRKLVTAQRKADNAKADGIASRSEDWAQFVSRLGGGAMAGQTLVYELSRTNETVRGIKFSQLQLVSITMMWKQAKGREHMLGKLDESGEPMGKWHYNQAFVDEAEAKLRPEAVAIREYLLKKYDEEYDALNAVYRRVYGLNLPKEQFYSPLVVNPVMATKEGMGVDPLTGAVYAEGSRSPGALRNRGAGVAEPIFRDALQTYFAHMLQMEHWKAYAVLNGEMTAVMGHRDIRNVVEAKAGRQAATVVSKWLQYFNEGGSKDAAAHLALNQVFNNALNRASAMALFGRISTLVLQSTQMGAAAAKMPLGSYLKRLSMLLTGQMGWGESLRSPYVQRRIAEMPPQVQIAMQGLLATKPNKVREAARKLGRLISGFDGLFTAGTYAMVYDYQRGLALKNGMTRQEAEAFAREEAERITDEVAQPTRAGARSIWELNTTNPLGRMAWAFGSEARKNLALVLFSASRRPKGELGRALLFVMVFNGLLAMVIRNAFRDLKDGDDDELFDEKNWGWGRMAAMWVSEPLYGFPVLGESAEGAIFAAAGEYQPKSGMLDVKQAVPALMRLPETAGEVLTGEADWRQVVRDGNRLLMAGGLMSSTLAAAASLSNLARDVFEIGKSRVGNDE